MNGTRAKPYAVLYVDDELNALKYFKQCFEDEYVIHTAANAWDGYQLLQQYGDEIGVLITDQRMPGENGVELMEKARKLNPNLVRILVTAYAEYQTAVDAVNEGRAFRYLHKPWDPEELSAIIRHGLQYYTALTEREQLLSEKADAIRHMIMADKVAGLGILAEGLNHHLRNALTVIRAFIDLSPLKLVEELQGAQPKDTSFWKDWQGQAVEQMERIQSLLEHLSTATHATSVMRGDTVDLVDILAETINTFSDALIDKGINVGAEIDPNLPKLIVNEDRFRQLWRLLFTQSITDLERGNDLMISASISDEDPKRQQLLVTWQDNANWPNHDRPANLFDPFFVRSRKPDDFGVNMMACYVIVHLHGGTIEAQPLANRGMLLTIRIPLDPSQTTPASQDFFQRLMDHEAKWQHRDELVAV
ncbi:MAG: response regulator [Verrucomicrobiaceae bacterium]|nr:response regulator [Verrucomicrobiaceae bacterium]